MKKILAVILAALMLFTLAACGGEEEPATTEPTTTAAPVDEAIPTANGYATVKEAGNWEYKGEYAPGMLEFVDKTVPGSKIYISEEQGFRHRRSRRNTLTPIRLSRM